MKNLILTIYLSIAATLTVNAQCGPLTFLEWGYDDVNQSFEFDWDDVPGAVQYELSYSFEGEPPKLHFFASSDASLSDLNAGTVGAYHFELTADCGRNGVSAGIQKDIVATVADVREVIDINCEDPAEDAYVIFSQDLFTGHPSIPDPLITAANYYSTLTDMCDCVDLIPPGELGK